MKLLIALVSAGVYLCATQGLFRNILKIRSRPLDKTVKLNVWLMAMTMSRFAGWTLVGAAVFPQEPVIGTLLIATRLPGAVLKGYAMLQKVETRPSWGLVLGYLLPFTIFVVLACIVLATTTMGEIAKIPLQIFVAICFIGSAVTLATEIRRLLRPSESTFGMLLIYQRWMLLNFVVTCILGFFSNDKGLGILMVGAYLVVSIEQAILVYLLERGRWRYRRRTIE